MPGSKVSLRQATASLLCLPLPPPPGGSHGGSLGPLFTLLSVIFPQQAIEDTMPASPPEEVLQSPRPQPNSGCDSPARRWGVGVRLRLPWPPGLDLSLLRGVQRARVRLGFQPQKHA